MAQPAPTPKHDQWLNGLLGIDPARLRRPSADGAAGPTLTLRDGAPPAGPSPLTDPPTLRLGLTPDEQRACGRYLDQHLDVLPRRGAPAIAADSYRPALDGAVVGIADAVRALLPLTLAGSLSKDGSDQMFKDTWSELYDMVQRRVAGTAAAKARAALDAATRAGAQKAVADAAEVDAWITSYLAGNALGPDIAGDGSGATVMFANKTTPFQDVIKRTVAAAQQAQFTGGDDARALVTEERVATIMTRRLLKARPKAPSAGSAQGKADDDLPSVSMQLGYTFTPATTHTTAAGTTSTDQPAHQISGTLNIAFHADDESGWEVSATGQVTWFADDAGGHIQTQSGLAGAQVAWVWVFLKGALQAGPMFQALVGASRAQQTVSNKLEWTPTGQVGLGGQVQYAIPGFNGHVLIGAQAGTSGTMAKGAEGTVDQTAGLTFTYKF